jgi:hypothetical protein
MPGWVTGCSVTSCNSSIRTLVLCSLFVLFDAFSGAQAADTKVSCQVFIATNGNDANPGTESRPFASLERARDYVRVHKAGATAPIEICLRGGTYELSRTFTLGPDDSGTAQAPVTYRSYPGERAILSGGVEIHPHWSRYKGQIQVAEVGRWFNELFVNGERATRARSPNGDASFNLAPVPDPTVQTSSFLYQPGSVPAGLRKSDMEIVSMERFISPRQRVASTDGTTLTVEGSIYSGVPYGGDYAPNDRYYIENSLDALDSPGEWYLDERAHKLYYWPRNPDEILHGEFVVPQLHQLVRGGSYQANTGWETAAAPYVSKGHCHHIGVYPQAPDSLTFGQESFTVATWLRFPAGTVDPFWVFSKGDPQGDTAAGAGGHGYGLDTQSTSATVPVLFYLNDGKHRISTNLPAQPRTAWVHFAFVVDRSSKQMRAYVNGVLADTADISALGSIASTVPLDVGAYTNAGCSNSAVGGFVIYARALSTAQVAQLAAGTTASTVDLALSLPFNGDFVDHSPRKNETVVFFAPAFTTGVAGARAADFSMTFPFDASGVSGSADYIGFSGLSFEYADWVMPFTGFPGSANFWTSPAAVYLHSRHASIVGNRFLHLGSDALAGLLANSLVADNEFWDVGGGAIKIGDSPPGSQAQQSPVAGFSSYDTVTGNRIRDTGIVDHDSFALWVTQGEHTTISKNTVTRAPYIGIASASDPGGALSYALGNNRICLNVVDHVMQLINDGGGIYVTGTQPGTLIDHNVIHDVLIRPAHLTNFNILGIVLDGTSNDFLVRDNLTYRIESGGILMNLYPDNSNNKVTNNIFVDGVEYQLIFYFASQDSFRQNIVYERQNQNTTLFYETVKDAIETSDYNLFYGPSALNFASQLSAWQALGFDAHSIVADPLFVDYAHHNFTLLPSSPAVLPIGSGGIGFQAIDFSGLPKL